MKKIVLIAAAVASLMVTSCTPKVTVPEKQIEVKTIKNGGREILIDEVNKAALQEPPYSGWFTSSYNSYQPKADVIEELKKPLQKYDVVAFFGSWCGDSKRGVPKVYKVLDQAGYNLNRLKIVAVGRSGDLYKKSPSHQEEGLNIKRVPTYIFFDKNGEEVGRVVESPIQTWEEDMLKIVTGQPYKNKYSK